jgi:hypothetical protein
VSSSAVARSRSRGTSARPRGLSIAQIADRLGRAAATIKAYFYDPTGEKARVVKARYVGVCRGCGAYTQPRNGKGDAYRYCKVCHPGAIEVRWIAERVLAAMRDWRDRYELPSSYEWSRTHARRRGGGALELRRRRRERANPGLPHVPDGPGAAPHGHARAGRRSSGVRIGDRGDVRGPLRSRFRRAVPRHDSR